MSVDMIMAANYSLEPALSGSFHAMQSRNAELENGGWYERKVNSFFVFFFTHIRKCPSSA